jgi:hypothetical protein
LLAIDVQSFAATDARVILNLTARRTSQWNFARGREFFNANRVVCELNLHLLRGSL